ncbi:MAG: hypothetical protein IMY80_01240, partial [Chloroflexi bacterium]|nr:hypothetical protein [Chloroflexota bacterium]
PIYGQGLDIQSLNFEKWIWIRFDEAATLIDSYRLLPAIFDDAGDSDMEHLISDCNLADGAAAMIAYARMQFSEMGEEERRAVEQALLKYCELDTPAMVMLWEYWSKELMGELSGTAILECGETGDFWIRLGEVGRLVDPAIFLFLW